MKQKQMGGWKEALTKRRHRLLWVERGKKEEEWSERGKKKGKGRTNRAKGKE